VAGTKEKARIYLEKQYEPETIGRMRPGRNGGSSGFTLRDLIAVLAVLLPLLLLAVPSVARNTERTQGILCLDNLRALSRGWQMYAEDNNGFFPLSPNISQASASASYWSTGYVDWSSSPQNSNPAVLSQLPFSGYLPSVSVYRCPSESEIKSAVQIRAGLGPRIRNFSMNTFVGNVSGVFYPGYRIYNKLSDMVAPTPSQLFVLIQEHADSINDSNYVPPMEGSLLDLVASTHDGAGTLSYADGHCEFKVWNPRTRAPIRFNFVGLPTAAPSDMQWLKARASARLP